jgi:8-hydroxy-5-deazaflavin:NADPH oxidoreductase
MRTMNQSQTPTETSESSIDIDAMVIGVLGGTGEQGRGLATRFSEAGLNVIIGSRTAERATDVAREVNDSVKGMSNEDTAAASDIVIVAVPWDGHRELLEGLSSRLAGKIVVDCVNPLGFDKGGAFGLDVPEGSAAQQAQAVLPDSTVVAAFHHISAKLLLDPEVTAIEGDVLVVGDERSATDAVQALASKIPGMRGVYAGKLRNAGQVEAFTANLISMNRRYKAHAGVHITDV